VRWCEKTRNLPSTINNPGPIDCREVMRTEVKDFMRMCERLMGLALQTGELSAEECDILSYYAKELHQTTHPLCEKHRCDTSVSSS
jgi:hypothetical protein